MARRQVPKDILGLIVLVKSSEKFEKPKQDYLRKQLYGRCQPLDQLLRLDYPSFKTSFSLILTCAVLHSGLCACGCFAVS